MCGRFANALSPNDYRNNIIRRFAGLDGPEASQRSRGRRREEGREQQRFESGRPNDGSEEDVQEAKDFESYYPTYNVAPGSRMPVVRLCEEEGGEGTKEGKKLALLIQTMRWGLLPRYTKSIPRGPDALRTINARDDAVLNGKSMWTPLLRTGKRCVVFAQGFYEWEKRGGFDVVKIPHFVGMRDEGVGRKDSDGKERALMPFAGLWENCKLEDEEEDTYSFTIITTDSNLQLNFLHDRMPVILPDQNAIRVWLGIPSLQGHTAALDEACALLKPYDAGSLDVYPVPKEVGRVGNNDPAFILPVNNRKDGIAAAFQKANKRQENEEATLKDANSETNAPLTTSSETSKRKEADGEESSSKKRKVEGEIGEKTSEASSKWSPEPFHPPISPPRPSGGYSNINKVKEGGDGKSEKSPKRSPSNKALQNAAKGTKDIRNFFK